MEQPEIFKAVLGLILPEIEVEKLTSLETERPFTVDYFFHGVRFDVLAKGHERFVDIEVQLMDTGELGERAMYYLSLLVARSLKKGMSYRHLGESCVVFFCKFDPFDQGLPVYEFAISNASLAVLNSLRPAQAGRVMQAHGTSATMHSWHPCCAT